MTDLHSALKRYLTMRKGLGYRYEHQTRRLADFVVFMEKRKATTITTKLAMEWATLPPDRHASWAIRLTDVRGFARHVANFDPRTEVPPVGILPGWKRAKPYVYSDAEINALLTAALALPPEEHRFAIRTLLDWYRDGKDVEQQLPVLSTYLGHAYVRDTYWYLSACPELMQEAARRLDRRWEAKP